MQRRHPVSDERLCYASQISFRQSPDSLHPTRHVRESEMQKLIALALFAAIATTSAVADQPLAWPQFRGPGGSSVADDQKPPVHVGPDKNVKWKVAAPNGISSPIVAGDLLVITAFD